MDLRGRHEWARTSEQRAEEVEEAGQWKKRRGEEEEEEDDKWGPHISERERGGPNCGSEAPDV